MTTWSSEAWSSAADMYLLARAREGSAEAFGELWRRHLSAAYAVAGRYRGRTAAEDIVAEASARVFALIKDGKGPEDHFRAYFLSAVRSVAIDHSRRDLRAVPTEDEHLEELGEPVLDLGDLEEEFDADLVREAFRGLSERDQRVLWHTTVEGAAPRVLAPVLGMTPNAVSARAMRAREALRAQYLDACAERSVAVADTEECRWTIANLGAHVRGRLPKRQNARVEAHLAECRHAAAVAADLRAIHAEFPALIVPFVLAAGLGTSGFVSGAAVSTLAAGGAVAGAAGATGVSATSGGVAAGAAAAPTPAGSPLGDAVGQLAGRATTLAAGIAIGAGLIAGPVQTTPVLATRPPATTPVTTQAPAPVPTTAAPVPTSRPAPMPTLTSRPAPPVRTTRVAPPAQPPAPSPRPTPAPAPPRVTPVPSVSVSPVIARVRLVPRGNATVFSVQVTGATGPVTLVVTAPSGALTPANHSWACVGAGSSTVTCTGQSGQLLLRHEGGSALTRVRVAITDSDGLHRWQTLPLQ